MESKFKVGQKVIVVDGSGDTVHQRICAGSILTVSNVWPAFSSPFIYAFEECSLYERLFECRLAAIDDEGWVTWEGGESWPQWLDGETEVEIKMRIGENNIDCVSNLRWDHRDWQGDILAYCTEHSKNAMKDELTPEELLKHVILDEDNVGSVDNVNDIACSFCWNETKQGDDYWREIYSKLSSEEACQEKQEAVVEDDGSAASSIHYNSLDIQPLELMQAMLSPEEFKGFLKGNILKYTMRKGLKPGETVSKDSKKAKQYKYWLELAEEGVTINPREHVV